MAEVQSCVAECDRKHNILCLRKETRELEREGLQMAASLYEDKSSTPSSLEQASNHRYFRLRYDLTRSTTVHIMVLLHLSAHKRRQQRQSRVAPMADTNNCLAC